MSHPQTSSGAYVASHTILKAFCAGVGFGSGTETSLIHYIKVLNS